MASSDTSLSVYSESIVFLCDGPFRAPSSAAAMRAPKLNFGGAEIGLLLLFLGRLPAVAAAAAAAKLRAVGVGAFRGDRSRCGENKMPCAAWPPGTAEVEALALRLLPARVCNAFARWLGTGSREADTLRARPAVAAVAPGNTSFAAALAVVARATGVRGREVGPLLLLLLLFEGVTTVDTGSAVGAV